MAANMYRVGDYVYFETSSTSPYQVRRIEELNKTPSGNVEAKVMCFYRRRDISSSLILLADKHQSALEEEQDEEETEDIAEQQRHQLKHRELFLSRQVETLPATHIRGKCVVTLLNETESLLSYLNKEDTFFYSLVYDPSQKTLLADKGEIRVGSKFQAELTKLLGEGEEDGRNLEEMETLIWSPEPPISDSQIDKFLVVARSVGTFARALDCTSTVRQPSLHMSAAAASRDVTLYHAMNTLHKHDYDIARAIASLVPEGGPVLCRDEMEEWSASEANLFEEALDKYGKDFNDIRQDFISWKTLKSIVEYYYMWKTTDRYVQQKRIKAAEAESKLKQVYIPNYNKPNPAAISNKMNGSEAIPGRACESCYATSSGQWYSWGPTHMQCRLCNHCWSYWKKYGGLKMPTRLDGERPAPNQRQERIAQIQAMKIQKCTIAGCGKEFKLKSHLARHLALVHGLTLRPSSPGKPILKTRAAFCLITTQLTRISRKVCCDLLCIKHAARNPFLPINVQAIKQECQLRLSESPEIQQTLALTPKKWDTVDMVCAKKGIDITIHPDLLRREGLSGEPAHIAFPAPSLEERTGMFGKMNRKRAYDEGNMSDDGMELSAAKRPQLGGIRTPFAHATSNRNLCHVNGRSKNTKSRRHLMNWVDAPDDVYFIATDNTRKIRKQMQSGDFKKVARKPWRSLNIKTPKSSKDDLDESIVILDD